MIRSLESDTFRKLAIILVAKAQGKVLVASESKEFVSIDFGAKVYKVKIITSTE